MREVQRMNKGCADIGVKMAREAPEPGVDRIDAFADGDKAAAIEDAFNLLRFGVGVGDIDIRNNDAAGEIPKSDIVAPKFLQRRIRVRRLVVGVSVEEDAFLIEQRLLDDCGDRLPLGEPLPAVFADLFGRDLLVERNEPRRPAIGEAEAIERVEKARLRGWRKPRTLTTRRCSSPSIGSIPPVSPQSARSASRKTGVSGAATGWRFVEMHPCR